jgi:hypothetical protein
VSSLFSGHDPQVPDVGTYNLLSMPANGKYPLARFANIRNATIGERTNLLLEKRLGKNSYDVINVASPSKIGPGSYESDFKKLSFIKKSRRAIFGFAKRSSVCDAGKDKVPGPGEYQLPREFGRIPSRVVAVKRS